MKRILLFFFTVIPLLLSAQYDDHRMSASEKLMIPSYMQNINSVQRSSVSSPPVSNVRTMAEWEELQGLLVTWTSYTPMIREIIRAAREETTVYVVCTNPATVYNSLLSNGIDTSNVICLNTPFNSVWSRDYGPWNAYTNEVDTLITIDWIYNRPRPDDDLIPVNIASVLGTPLYQTTASPDNLVHTGGNFMTDGAGTGFSSLLIDVENSPAGGFGINHTPAEIDTIMKHYMGINRYIKMNTLPYDVIHHIDMHMKLLDEETILMGQYPAGVADGPQIEANLLYVLNNFTSCYGTPYKVIRIPMPADNGIYPDNGGDYFTYTNSSFINKTIIVPTYNIPSDTTAIRIYKEALPGYTVTGINSTASIGALGALHCITKELGTSDPLLIRHQPLANTSDTLNGYTVNAYIRHRSGIQQANLFWTTDTSVGYSSLIMNTVNGTDFTALIPPQPPGTFIYYYIGAQATSGKASVRPMPAPAGFWKFHVTGVTALPAIEPKELDRVFSNPSKGITCVTLDLLEKGKVNIELYDASGRKVFEQSQNIPVQGGHRVFFDTSALASGMYIVRVNTPAGDYRTTLAVR